MSLLNSPLQKKKKNTGPDRGESAVPVGRQMSASDPKLECAFGELIASRLEVPIGDPAVSAVCAVLKHLGATRASHLKALDVSDLTDRGVSLVFARLVLDKLPGPPPSLPPPPPSPPGPRGCQAPVPP